MKKKTIVPLIVFLVGICLLSVFTYNTNVQIQKDRRTIAKLNAVTYGQRIENDIENGIEITDTLKQVLINGNGQIINFFQNSRKFNVLFCTKCAISTEWSCNRSLS